jgi:uncharacterized protein YecE (DUF72 family)
VHEGRIVVGTSTWADPGYLEAWYPAELPAREHLRWYAERFEGVEVDATFHALPDRGRVQRWVERTPAGFGFDVKLHRLLSRHPTPEDGLPAGLRERATTWPDGSVRVTPRIEDEVAAQLLDAIEPLQTAGRLRTYLLQLPPRFSPDRHELGELADLVLRLAPHPVAGELRHRAWLAPGRVDETLAWLADHGAVYVCVDTARVDADAALPPLDAVTHPRVAYLRAHGRNPAGFVAGRGGSEPFGWAYDDDELEDLAERAEARAGVVPEVRVMFTSTRGADAPRAARRLRELLGQDVDVGAGTRGP